MYEANKSTLFAAGWSMRAWTASLGYNTVCIDVKINCLHFFTLFFNKFTC